MENIIKKPRIVFCFVEAGLGHIMPMKAIADAFETKYGDRVEVVRTYFFQDTKNPDMKFVENELVKEVKLHNKHKWRGVAQGLGIKVLGYHIAMSYLMKNRYKRGLEASMQYLKDLQPDYIFNTHFSTAYYSCEARRKKLIDAGIFTYCTDPVIGSMWDYRSDMIGVSSEYGQKRAQNSFAFRNTKIVNIPFLIRTQVKEYTKSREEYKRELGLPDDRFTILLADGAYGAGKLRETVFELLKTDQKINIIAVCGKNEELYKEFCALNVPQNICFRPYGFCDKMLLLSAACDLFIGKAGSSNLAEPIYFGAPSIVTFCATFVEKWICEHQVNNGCVVKETNIKKAVSLALNWAKNPAKMEAYKNACKAQKRADGPEILADILFKQIQDRTHQRKNQTFETCVSSRGSVLQQNELAYETNSNSL